MSILDSNSSDLSSDEYGCAVDQSDTDEEDGCAVDQSVSGEEDEDQNDTDEEDEEDDAVDQSDAGEEDDDDDVNVECPYGHELVLMLDHSKSVCAHCNIPLDTGDFQMSCVQCDRWTLCRLCHFEELEACYDEEMAAQPDVGCPKCGDEMETLYHCDFECSDCGSNMGPAKECETCNHAMCRSCYYDRFIDQFCSNQGWSHHDGSSDEDGSEDASDTDSDEEMSSEPEMTCPYGHDLKGSRVGASVQTTCDQCYRVLATGETRMRCEGCDYDICSLCVDHKKFTFRMEVEQRRLAKELHKKETASRRRFDRIEAKVERRRQRTRKITFINKVVRLELASRLNQRKFKAISKASDVETYSGRQAELFQAFCEKVSKKDNANKTTKPSVAVLGPSGVGKSSLINTIVGKEVTRVGIVETTMKMAKCYTSNSTEFYDVPGENDERSYSNLASIMAIKEMHLIILVYVSRVGHIIKLEKLIRACKVPYIVVRNKIDDVDLDEAKNKGFQSRSAYLQDALKTEREQLQGNLVFVSARTGEGIDDLRSIPEKYGVRVKLQED